MPAWLVASATVAGSAVTAVRTAAWAGAGSACACGARQTAAAMPASAGTAAVGSRCFRMRDFFLWLPKGLLLVQFALTGKTAQGACCLRRRLTSEETLTGTRGRISQNGQICFRVARLPVSGILNVLSLHIRHTGPVRYVPLQPSEAALPCGFDPQSESIPLTSARQVTGP